MKHPITIRFRTIRTKDNQIIVTPLNDEFVLPMPTGYDLKKLKKLTLAVEVKADAVKIVENKD